MNAQLQRPFKMTISFTERCNLECRLCYADCSESRARDELATGEWLHFFDQIEELGVLQLYFEGGEPFVRDDFPEILHRVGRRFFTLVRTNATLIDAAMAREIKTANVARMYVDLLGANAATHDELTGVAGSFDATLRGIENLKLAGLTAIPLVIVNRLNLHELDAIIELTRALDLGRIGLLRLYPLGRAKARWDRFAMTLDEQERVIASLQRPQGMDLMLSWHPFNRNCCWNAAAINAYGRSIGCAYLREYVDFGDIRESTFMDTWRHPTYELLRSGKVDSSCSGCRTMEGTDGGCRAAAFAYHGRWTAPDPYCNDGSDTIDLRELAAHVADQSA